jgi:ParB/RepB/Spo0J family partition protein
MSEMRVSQIPIDLIDEDVSNHRLSVDPEADRQLQQSIAERGVQQPIKVANKGAGRFTLVFGFRRKAAATAAGLTAIPAIVEQGLDENAIRVLQAVENLERRELHPMEEARFCDDLARSITRRPGKQDSDDISEAVAQRIGRSRRWVEARLAMARLSPRVKQAFSNGDIHLAHAQLIARLASHEAQEEVLGAVQARTPSWLEGRQRAEARTPPETIARTREHVERRLRDLDSVPWKLDAAFAERPACSSCPQNSANRLDLFDNDQPKKPQCLDAACYSVKTKAASRAVVKATNTALKEFGPKVTPTEAKGAIGMREVGFIQTKAVVDAAKRRQAPDKPTPAERRGADNWKRQNAVRDLHDKQLHDWSSKLYEQLATYIDIDDPIILAMSVLIRSSGIVDFADGFCKPADSGPMWAKDPQGTLKDCFELLADARDSAEGHRCFAELAQLLQPWLMPQPRDEHQHLIALENDWAQLSDGPALRLLAEAYDLTPPPAPTLEEAEAQLEEKAA